MCAIFGLQTLTKIQFGVNEMNDCKTIIFKREHDSSQHSKDVLEMCS